ncbi:MAG: TetR/AcrR family transcriptional regulator [Bacteroidales bacterium]|jgi:AcrR family transcriptional regulator|nr:TetR/AcrR family transcriptional regulator [Bacteroidales bacterium]
MPRTKEQYEKIRREKRELISETALKLFAENGYDATSINEIAQSAGISKGLMYNYFSSKEDLLQTIWDNLTLEFENMIDPNRDGNVTDEEAEDFIDRLFEHLKTKRHIYKLYYQLSFQPKVVRFLTTKYKRNQAANSQNLIIDYFSKKLPHSDITINYFTVLVFWKGLAMVTTYTEDYFGNDFLDKYKNSLKSIFFKDKSDV